MRLPLNPPLHIWWGLSSQPVAYESVPWDFLSPGWDQLSPPSFCPPPPLHYSMQDLFGQKLHILPLRQEARVRMAGTGDQGHCTYTHTV